MSSIITDHFTAPGNYQNLFVAKLPVSVSNKELEDIFCAFRPSSATVMLDALTGRSKGYGFVLFDSEDSGRKAAAALDKTTASVPRSGSSHFAFELTIFASKHFGREVAAENECLYIRNIPNSWPMHEVESFIAQHGKPVYSAVRSDHHGSPVWVVFVEYDSVESARATLKAVHGTRVVQSGPPILAKYAESEEVKRNRRDRKTGGKNNGKLKKERDVNASKESLKPLSSSSAPSAPSANRRHTVIDAAHQLHRPCHATRYNEMGEVIFTLDSPENALPAAASASVHHHPKSASKPTASPNNNNSKNKKPSSTSEKTLVVSQACTPAVPDKHQARAAVLAANSTAAGHLTCPSVTANYVPHDRSNFYSDIIQCEHDPRAVNIKKQPNAHYNPNSIVVGHSRPAPTSPFSDGHHSFVEDANDTVGRSFVVSALPGQQAPSRRFENEHANNCPPEDNVVMIMGNQQRQNSSTREVAHLHEYSNYPTSRSRGAYDSTQYATVASRGCALFSQQLNVEDHCAGMESDSFHDLSCSCSSSVVQRSPSNSDVCLVGTNTFVDYRAYSAHHRMMDQRRTSSQSASVCCCSSCAMMGASYSSSPDVVHPNQHFCEESLQYQRPSRRSLTSRYRHNPYSCETTIVCCGSSL